MSRDVTFDGSGMLQQEKSQEKEKQSGDAQQVELETSVIPIKTVQTILTEWSSRTHEPHIGGESPMYAITFGTKQSVLGRGIKLCSSYC